MIINGKKRDFPDGTSVLDMLRELSLDVEKVVVEVNASIIEKTMFSDHKLSSGDKIEIIAFVGGG
ncbi:sulfur carrier protein ThiS [Fusibacter sp. JL216-2]|uniref:sulfur carrier protein ThiS n=1 Tax=Fusibacter sp. JL216-2 TaxID=3071453 RepID=UPI003D32CC8A